MNEISLPESLFRALFEGSPGRHLILNPHLTIVAVSDDYLRATMTRREEILGRRVFEAFPDNPDDPEAMGVGKLRASFERVLVGKTPEAVPTLKYDIRRPESEGGGFEERYWEPINSPVLGPDGEVAYIIHTAIDVTGRVRAEGRSTSILESISDGFVALDREWRFIYMNAAAERLNGQRREEVFGRTQWEVFPSCVGTTLDREFRRAVAEQVTTEFENYYEPWDRWFSLKAYPSKDGGLSVYYQDITERKRAEEEIRAGRARLRRIIEGAKDYAIVELDGEGDVVYWNSGAERLMGWSEAEILGKPGATFFTPEAREKGDPEEEMERARTTGRAENEQWHLRKDGSRFWASGLAMPLTDGDGESPGSVTGFVKVLQDRTDQRATEEALKASEERAEQGRKLFYKLVEQCPFGIYIVDADFRMATMNRGSHDGAFANVRPVIGRPFDEVMRVMWPEPVAADAIRAFRHTLDTGESYYAKNFVNPRADKDRVEGYEWEIHRVTLPDGRPGVTCYYYDSTELRTAEAALRDADRKKDEFLAMLAHELRNPLAAISNASQVAKRSKSEEHREWSQEVIVTQVKNLSLMIDDLLDVSRITRGKIQLKKQPLRLTPIINSAVEAARPLMEERKHRLILDLDPKPLPVEGDPTRLEQIVVNLLNNAAKYTESGGGRITLTTAGEGPEVVITVEDTGIGITPELLARVFDLFAQGDRTIARSEGGLGIGLTLVKSLVELHGGSIRAESDGPGRGSRFTVRLPLAKERAVPAVKGGPPVVDAAKGGSKVLVVDDNEDTARGMGRLLKLLGHDVRTAHDGPSAVREARDHRPDIILLDIGLPGMDGYQVAQTLRDEGFDRTVIIAVSGYGEETAQVRSRESGFDHHLVKPVDFESLVALIGRTH